MEGEEGEAAGATEGARGKRSPVGLSLGQSYNGSVHTPASGAQRWCHPCVPLGRLRPREGKALAQVGQPKLAATE